MYLGVDWGTKKIGLAVGSKIPYELATLNNDGKIFDRILKLCQEENIEKIVIGMPMFESGDENENAGSINEFGKKLKDLTKKPIYFEPENLTTQTALQLLKEEGATPDEIEQKVDQLAARLILEQYIDNQGEVSEESL
ncbi:MAG: putative holliday junction resolvase [Candidatus Berkelbacteria bacterium Athens1014_28]|uniref:Putative pre-16S rRNA nuclease n=1 Tax=Candidatus Berkelbacteria bacterium Athens1014_28 TaxID=2017145 RepID=A0A554LP09_9BACT|nr:MAG: putative holliday junction resolvase [Candidatus Berkelbacteria bacterium Athens1014_28]